MPQKIEYDEQHVERVRNFEFFFSFPIPIKVFVNNFIKANMLYKGLKIIIKMTKFCIKNQGLKFTY